MQINNMTLIIGGDAGQGIESSGAGFCKALARSGLHVFSVQDHRSRIRGGHNFYLIKTAAQPITSWTEPVQLVIALTPETIEQHLPKIVPGGALLYDQEFNVDPAPIKNSQVLPVPVPFNQIAIDTGGNKVMANTAALGAVAGLTRLPLESIFSVIQDNFKKKGESIIQTNIAVAQAAFDYVVAEYGTRYEWQLQKIDTPPRMVINGNQAIGLGALTAGCNFTAAYPMTPATSVFQWLTDHADRYGIVSKQTEDEIAAICMGIGAAHVGARALIPTSGGGLSLMTEGLGLAGITETPIVVVVAQRPGPATGLATRTEQADLLFVIHASQGEFPRIVLAPGTIEQCFYNTIRAFNLAEKYQTPVFIMTDAFLAGSIRTLEKTQLDFQAVQIDRGELLTVSELDQLTESYKRYAFTESGISQRVVPGHPRAIFHATSNEHDESGFLTEEAEMRTKMQTKRMKKLALAEKEMNPPQRYGPHSAENTFICWGSTIAPLEAAMQILNQEKAQTANIFQFIDLWPMPAEKVRSVLNNTNRLITVEGNSTGQLARLLKMTAGIDVTRHILKYDGRPFSPEYILKQFKEVV